MRILLLIVLFGTIGVGLYDFLVAPSRETAMQVLVPTQEKFDRSQRVVEPVYDFVSSQTPESMLQMARQAGREIQGGLKDVPISSLEARVGLSPRQPLEASGAGMHPDGPPGLAWYHGRTTDE